MYLLFIFFLNNYKNLIVLHKHRCWLTNKVLGAHFHKHSQQFLVKNLQIGPITNRGRLGILKYPRGHKCEIV